MHDYSFYVELICFMTISVVYSSLLRGLANGQDFKVLTSIILALGFFLLSVIVARICVAKCHGPQCRKDMS